MATAVLGAWLGITLLMWFVAGGSFSTLERVLRAPAPGFVEQTRALRPAETRIVLRYLASEINRHVFHAYGWAQVVLGALLVALLWREDPRGGGPLAIAAGMLTLALVLTFVITPKIVVLGRSLDFVPRDPVPPAMAGFRRLHAAFATLDGAKLLAGLALVFLLSRRRM